MKDLQSTPAEAPPALVGGRCAYVDLPGTATIVSIAATSDSKHQATIEGGPGYEGLEVGFEFAPRAPIEDEAARDWAEDTHTLLLANSWYPGPRFLAKYGIVPGQGFEAVLRIRTQGSCTPYLIDFPAIDRADYFESR
jgi:hypothetical protein